MTKQEYMDKLREKLAGFDEDIRNEIFTDYEEHFTMGAANGKTEEQICEELGSIDELVDELNKLTGKEQKSGKGIHIQIDEEQFKQAADNISKTMSDTAKNIAGFLGSFAATVTKGTTKFTSNVGDTAGTVFNNISDKAGDFAKAFAEGFENVAGKVKDKSGAFAKEFSDSFNRSMNKDAAEAATKSAPETEEDPCAPFFNQAEGETAQDTEDAGCVREETCDEEGSKLFTAEKCDSIVIQTDCGDVVAEASEDGSVHVEYENDGTTNQKLAYGFDFRQEGSTIYAVAKKRPGTSNFFKSMSCPDITVTVQIPEGLKNVAIRTLSGDVNASDINVAQMSISTMSGDVDLDNCIASECEISTMSGDIGFSDCSFVGGKCSTVSGDISSDDSTLQHFEAKTTSGDIDLDETTTRDMNAETISGDIDIELAAGDGYLAHVKTTCGDVRLDYNDETIEIIRSGSYVMGAGEIKLNLTSVSGDITVEAGE